MSFSRTLSVAMVVLAASLALTAQAPTARAAAGDPKVYMAWHAPYGTPGATVSIDPTCPDSTHRDTLFLSFELTRPESAFIGVGGELRIYSQAGDTLGSFWDMGRGGKNHGGLTAYFQNGEGMPDPSPWAGSGTGNITFDRRPTACRVKFGEVMAMYSGTQIAMGQRYVIGRIVLCRKGARLTGCDRPVCIEWRKGEFVFGPERSIFPNYTGTCSVTRGDGASACAMHRLEWEPPPGLGTPGMSVQIDTVRTEDH